MPKSFELNTGAKIPAIGLGTWRSAPNAVAESVQFALQNGCRHIDAALRYGNEAEVGRGIKTSGVPRSEIFLTTKLWNTYHHRVEEGLQESLKNLETDYLDLYLIHWPVSLPEDASNTTADQILSDVDFTHAWAKMQEMVDRGLVRAIGVSNFTPTQFERLFAAPTTKIVPAVNQVELHPLNPQPELFKYCSEKGIHLTAYSPLGSQDSPLYEVPALKEVSERLGRTIAQVLLAWGVAKGWSVVPKSVNQKRILQNIDAEFELSAEDFKTVDSIATRKRLIDGQDFLPVKVFDI